MYATELIHPFHKKSPDRNGKANLDVYITVHTSEINVLHQTIK